MTGSVYGSIRRPDAGQVALTSGPLALDRCNDSPRHGEPVEIISSGPLSAEGRLAYWLLRIASQGITLDLTCQLRGQVHCCGEHRAGYVTLSDNCFPSLEFKNSQNKKFRHSVTDLENDK
ncbi:hypothetical protein F2P81_001381 [Xyrichtys novacula]|uniref:Uncharacterized protein n=1 Tax=Xyrichtys novacula TaxID=13765 RepID=A0AAV1HMA9_XYRNO|nr:hypothetical protein F2P81_001381 [Xyrichtys novacula]